VLCCKSLPYLSSLVSIATSTRSMRTRRYISMATPKANTSFGRHSFQFSAANDWNELEKSVKLEVPISLTNFKHQLKSQSCLSITAPVYSPSVNSPPYYLIPIFVLLYFLSCCSPVSLFVCHYLHIRSFLC